MFEKAFTEVNEILENMDESYVNQISKSFRRMIIENMDLNYEFRYDSSKSFMEQEISDDAKAIMAIIYMEYWATNEEKETIKKQIEVDEKEVYDVFKSTSKKAVNQEEKQIETALVEVKKKNFLLKVFERIKNFFKKK